MKHIITEQELMDYASGKLYGKAKRDLERRALQSGQSDLLLYAMQLDYDCCDTDTDDLIGEDTFEIEAANTGFSAPWEINLPRAADHIASDELE